MQSKSFAFADWTKGHLSPRRIRPPSSDSGTSDYREPPVLAQRSQSDHVVVVRKRESVEDLTQIRPMHRDVRWLNGDRDRFICLSAESFQLYELDEDLQVKIVTELPISPSLRIEQNHLRCFSLSPHSDDALALGYANGKVLVSRLAVDPDIRSLKNANELSCEPSRPVVNLDFSPISSHHLAACFEGNRAEFSVCVLELNRPKMHTFHLNSVEHVSCTTWFQDDGSLIGMGGTRTVKLYDIREGTRPTFTHNVPSAVRAMCSDVVRASRFTVLVGQSLLLYDRRSSRCPLHTIHLQSFPEGDTGPVDLRWNRRYPYYLTCLRRNLRTINQIIIPACEEPELQSHCFLEELDGRLEETDAELEEAREETDFHDPHGSALEADLYEEEGEDEEVHGCPYVDVFHHFPIMEKISGFSWHPKQYNRLVLVGPDTAEGSKNIKVVDVNDFVSASFSPDDHLAHSVEKDLCIHKVLSPNDDDLDISYVMKLRAERNYGTPGTTALEAYVRSCKEVIDSCPHASEDVRWVWKWIRQMVSVVEWKPEVYGTWFPGVMQVMQHYLTSNSTTSSTERIFVTDSLLGRTRIYKGRERDRILRLCGWPPFDDSSLLDVFLTENSLERMNQSRAVAVAVFTGHSFKMKRILSNMVEVARSTNDKGREEMEKFYDAVCQYKGVPDQWKPIAENLKKYVTDPYFKMILTFLNGRCDSYNDQHQILRQEDVPLEDRIAFAAIHFNDQHFLKSVNAVFKDTRLHRSLQGLFVVGLAPHADTHQLLSAYVDDTGDIQTATVLLIVGQCFAQTLPRARVPSGDKSSSADCTIENITGEETDDFEKMEKCVLRSYNCVQEYLNTLNLWEMWIQRARFDCLLKWKKNRQWRNPKLEQNSSEAEVCCQFCPCPVALVDKSDITNMPLSSTVRVHSSRSAISSATSSSSNASFGSREVACQQCMKPLPKCILCRRHMGSPVLTECPDLGRLSSWFTWCQACRHGGHMVHMWHWFRTNEVCAASGCSCCCRIADLEAIKRNVDVPDDPCPHCEDL